MYFTLQATVAGRSSCQTGTAQSLRNAGWDLGLGFYIPKCVGNGISPQHHRTRPSTLKQKLESRKARLSSTKVSLGYLLGSWRKHRRSGDPAICPPPKQATHIQCTEEITPSEWFWPGSLTRWDKQHPVPPLWTPTGLCPHGA